MKRKLFNKNSFGKPILLVLAFIMCVLSACIKKSTVKEETPQISFVQLSNKELNLSDSSATDGLLFLELRYQIKIDSRFTTRKIIKELRFTDAGPGKINYKDIDIAEIPVGTKVIDAERANVLIAIDQDFFKNKLQINDSVLWRAELVDFAGRVSAPITIPAFYRIK